LYYTVSGIITPIGVMWYHHTYRCDNTIITPIGVIIPEAV